MARLIIVRHAESALNLQNRIQGHTDSGLTPRGVMQARRLAVRLGKFHVDRVYSSDLGRAYSTVLEVRKFISKPVIRDPLLREIHLGEWEGKSPEEVDRLYNKGYQRWLLRPSGCRIPGSETLAKFRKRVTGRIRQIARENHGRHVLVVTHGGVITALLSDWLDADFDSLLLRLHIENTSMTLVDLTQKRFRVWAVNDTTHLLRTDVVDGKLFSKRKAGP